VFCAKSLSSQQDFLFFLVFFGGRETNIINPLQKEEETTAEPRPGDNSQGDLGQKTPHTTT